MGKGTTGELLLERVAGTGPACTPSTPCGGGGSRHVQEDCCGQSGPCEVDVAGDEGTVVLVRGFL